MSTATYISSTCPVSGQSPTEELINYLTHGIGSLLSAAGLALLVVFASLYGNAWHIVSFSIYGASLVLLYLSSTIYHASRSVKLKRVLRVIDHATIYLLIAGTYTPFLLVTLRGGWGWSLFGVQWGLAITGIIAKIFFINRFKKTSTLVYLGMGWLIVVAIFPLIDHLALPGLIWLILGGVAYSGGTIFYVWEKLRFHHAIWHLFVITGSVCHFFAILLYVLPWSETT